MFIITHFVVTIKLANLKPKFFLDQVRRPMTNFSIVFIFSFHASGFLKAATDEPKEK